MGLRKAAHVASLSLLAALALLLAVLGPLQAGASIATVDDAHAGTVHLNAHAIYGYDAALNNAQTRSSSVGLAARSDPRGRARSTPFVGALNHPGSTGGSDLTRRLSTDACTSEVPLCQDELRPAVFCLSH